MSGGDIMVEVEGKTSVFNPQCCSLEQAAEPLRRNQGRDERSSNSNSDVDNDGESDDEDDEGLIGEYSLMNIRQMN